MFNVQTNLHTFKILICLTQSRAKGVPQHRAGRGDVHSMVWLILECGLREYSTMLWAGGICSCHVFHVGGTAAGRQLHNAQSKGDGYILGSPLSFWVSQTSLQCEDAFSSLSSTVVRPYMFCDHTYSTVPYIATHMVSSHALRAVWACRCFTIFCVI